MAGHYFYDPRPYYGLDKSTNLMPLDELFYKYEPVPYWMDQRMAAMSYPDYHPGHVKQVMTRGPEVQKLLPYSSPELAVRDNIYADIYKRSPHFNSFVPYAQPRGVSQDDTWVHTMAPHYANPQNQVPQQGMLPYRGYGTVVDMPMPMQMGYLGNNGSQQHIKQADVPMHGQMSSQKLSNANYNGGEQYGQIEVTNRGSKNHNSNNNSSGTKSTNKQMYNNDETYGNVKNSNQMYANDDTYGNKSKKELYNNDDGYGGKTSKKLYNNDDSYGNKSNGNTNYGVSTKGSNAKQQQRYTNDDSSSDDDEDEYGNSKSGTKSGGKWGTKPLLKHTKSDTNSHGKNDTNSHGKNDKEMGSKMSGKGTEYQSYGSNNMVLHDSGKKQSGHKNGSQTKSSKVNYQNGVEGSSDEDESYAYTNKASKAGQHNQGITKVQHNHGHDGREQSARGFDSHAQNYVQQPKHTQFHSQLKSVELKVPICCDNCERKVKACLEYTDGVENILCDQWLKKVTVYGNVKPDVILKRVKKVKKASELWQQVKRIPVY